jgi:beta-1,4-mannosyltransferase
VDPGLAAGIQMRAQSMSNVILDMREETIPDADLEAAIDGSHAVVLPYAAVLNSGSAIMALSRQRPVLAPRTGSLVELQSMAGSRWLYLYDGEFTAEILTAFLGSIQTRDRETTLDLSSLDWEPVSRIVGDFIEEIAVGVRGSV